MPVWTSEVLFIALVWQNSLLHPLSISKGLAYGRVAVNIGSADKAFGLPKSFWISRCTPTKLLV
jgi:hypothetical protein